MSEQDDKEWEAMTEDAYEHGDLKDRLKTAEARIERMDSLVCKMLPDIAACLLGSEKVEQRIERLEAAILSHKESIEILMSASLNDVNRINALEQRNGETR